MGAAAQASDPQARIIGGGPAGNGEWPAMAAVIESGGDPFWDQFCGGSLIRADWILTAAHCFYDGSGQQIRFTNDVEILVGLNNLTAGQGERISVTQVIPHPQYNDFTLDNDIALMKLSRASQQTPILESDANTIAQLSNGATTTAIGWGTTSYDPPDYPIALHEVDVPYIDTSTCNAIPTFAGLVTSNMHCAGLPQGGKDTCFGDSGGPLMLDVGGKHRVIGITSWGNGCAEPNLPGVYTKVGNYEDWILTTAPEPSLASLAATALLTLLVLSRQRRCRDVEWPPAPLS